MNRACDELAVVGALFSVFCFVFANLNNLIPESMWMHFGVVRARKCLSFFQFRVARKYYLSKESCAMDGKSCWPSKDLPSNSIA